MIRPFGDGFLQCPRKSVHNHLRTVFFYLCYRTAQFPQFHFIPPGCFFFFLHFVFTGDSFVSFIFTMFLVWGCFLPIWRMDFFIFQNFVKLAHWITLFLKKKKKSHLLSRKTKINKGNICVCVLHNKKLPFYRQTSQLSLTDLPVQFHPPFLLPFAWQIQSSATTFSRLGSIIYAHTLVCLCMDLIGLDQDCPLSCCCFQITKHTGQPHTGPQR